MHDHAENEDQDLHQASGVDERPVAEQERDEPQPEREREPLRELPARPDDPGQRDGRAREEPDGEYEQQENDVEEPEEVEQHASGDQREPAHDVLLRVLAADAEADAVREQHDSGQRDEGGDDHLEEEHGGAEREQEQDEPDREDERAEAHPHPAGEAQVDDPGDRVLPLRVLGRDGEGLQGLEDHQRERRVVDQVHDRVLLGVVPVHVDAVVLLRLVGVVLAVPVARDRLGGRDVDRGLLPGLPQRLGDLLLGNDHLPDPLVEGVEEVHQRGHAATSVGGFLSEYLSLLIRSAYGRDRMKNGADMSESWSSFARIPDGFPLVDALFQGQSDDRRDDNHADERQDQDHDQDVVARALERRGDDDQCCGDVSEAGSERENPLRLLRRPAEESTRWPATPG